MERFFDYEGLTEMGYSSSQINQLLTLKNYFQILNILEEIKPDVDVDLLRQFNSFLKSNEVDKYPALLHFLGHNEDPVLFLEEKQEEKSFYISKILNKKIQDKENGSENDLDYYGLIHYIKRNDLPKEILKTLWEEFSDNTNVVEYLRDGFNSEQILFAKRLYTASCDKFIDYISKLNKYPAIKYDVLHEMKNGDCDFVKIINNYEESEFQTIMRWTKEGYDINKYICDKEYKGNIYLCKKMIDMGLIDEEIERILSDIPYDIKSFEIDTLEPIISAKLIGCDVEKYFTIKPSESDVNLLVTLFNQGYSETRICEYLNLFYKHFSKNPTLQNKDFLKIIELYEEDIDVSTLITSNVNAETIDYLVSLSKEFNIELSEMVDKRFYPFELKLLNICREYERDDVAKCVICASYPDEDAYNTFGYIIKMDKSRGTKHKITNLFFDKGADVFEDYSDYYEFGEEQKVSLGEIINDGLMDDKNIDLIRDVEIDDEVMYELAEMFSEGLDITSIIPKADKFSYQEVAVIRKCMEMGFEFNLKDKNREK